MEVNKFGGASIRDSSGVKNLLSILKTKKKEKLFIVVSAMGKTTNNFEKVVQNYFDNQKDLDYSLKFIYDYHYQIINELFENSRKKIFEDLKLIFKAIKDFLKITSNRRYFRTVPFLFITKKKWKYKNLTMKKHGLGLLEKINDL